ncbi:hypothetical protein ACFWFK_04920 [Micromonospora chalcea]
MIELATPVVSRWFTHQVTPSVKARWKKGVEARKCGRRTIVAKAETRAALETSVEPPSIDVGHEVGAVIDPQRPVMGREEALQRLRLARAAELVRDEQLRIVRESWIVDDEDLPELSAAAVTLPKERLGGGAVQLMLEATPSPAKEVRVIQLGDILDTDPWPRDAMSVRPRPAA